MERYKNIADIIEAWGDFKDARVGGDTKAHWVKWINHPQNLQEKY